MNKAYFAYMAIVPKLDVPDAGSVAEGLASLATASTKLIFIGFLKYGALKDELGSSIIYNSITLDSGRGSWESIRLSSSHGYFNVVGDANLKGDEALRVEHDGA